MGWPYVRIYCEHNHPSPSPREGSGQTRHLCWQEALRPRTTSSWPRATANSVGCLGCRIPTRPEGQHSLRTGRAQDATARSRCAAPAEAGHNHNWQRCGTTERHFGGHPTATPSPREGAERPWLEPQCPSHPTAKPPPHQSTASGRPSPPAPGTAAPLWPWPSPSLFLGSGFLIHQTQPQAPPLLTGDRQAPWAGMTTSPENPRPHPAGDGAGLCSSTPVPPLAHTARFQKHPPPAPPPAKPPRGREAPATHLESQSSGLQCPTRPQSTLPHRPPPPGGTWLEPGQRPSPHSSLDTVPPAPGCRSRSASRSPGFLL